MQQDSLKLSQFIPPKEHLYYESICKAQVPLSPRGLPDLLLYGLPLQISNEGLAEIELEGTRSADPMDADEDLDVGTEEQDNQNDEVTKEEPLHTPTKKALQIAAKLSKLHTPGNCMVLLGVSGCSKTRTLYEVLSRKYGLYFTGSVGGNGGSGDVQWLVSRLEEELRNTQEKEALGSHYTNALLYARLIVLSHFLDLPWHNPYNWLLLQVRMSVLSVDQSDLFTLLTQVLLASHPTDLLNAKDKLLGIVIVLWVGGSILLTL
jgi:hypothetical protein